MRPIEIEIENVLSVETNFFKVSRFSRRSRPEFFFFKQKTAYEIGVRLVGSEMCIRDRCKQIRLGTKISIEIFVKILRLVVSTSRPIEIEIENVLSVETIL